MAMAPDQEKKETSQSDHALFCSNLSIYVLNFEEFFLLDFS